MVDLAGLGLDAYANVAGAFALVIIAVIGLSVLYWMAVGPVRF